MKTQSSTPFPTTVEKWNMYQTVSYINQTSFINEEDITVYEADMVIEGEIPNLDTKTRPQPAFALLSEQAYSELNDKISAAKGYHIGERTERYASLEPELAKINIQTDEKGNETSFDTVCVMQISSELQMEYPELLEGIELVKEYTTYETNLK